jgi:beta-xylosidase
MPRLKNGNTHPDNPVLTHRDKVSPISATGHADMVETQHGEWWALHLGVRKRDNHHKLGARPFSYQLCGKNMKMDLTGHYSILSMEI